MLDTQNTWKKADAVCFDVDSTVTTEEGIDELAKFCNKSDKVINLTNQAMAGNMTFRQSIIQRLNIIQPTIMEVSEFIKSRPATLTPGIKNLVSLLHKRQIPVYLISGGFKSLISPVAEQLNIPQENIFANRLKFYYTGEYAGFDENSPTSETGGKGKVIQNLKNKYGYKNLVLIGDGATDLEACPPADAFIGFGGNIIREQVKAKSKWYITDFEDLINILGN